MAKLINPVIGPNDSNKLVQPGFYRFFTTEASTTLICMHIKTNVPRNSDIMSMIEAVGHNYKTNTGIRCAWVFYAYSGGGLYIGLKKLYNGFEPKDIYYSVDGYVVIVALSHYQGFWYNGFTLNGYQVAGNGREHKLQVLGIAQSSELTGAF